MTHTFLGIKVKHRATRDPFLGAAVRRGWRCPWCPGSGAGQPLPGVSAGLALEAHSFAAPPGGIRHLGAQHLLSFLICKPGRLRGNKGVSHVSNTPAQGPVLATPDVALHPVPGLAWRKASRRHAWVPRSQVLLCRVRGAEGPGAGGAGRMQSDPHTHSRFGWEGRAVLCHPPGQE